MSRIWQIFGRDFYRDSIKRQLGACWVQRPVAVSSRQERRTEGNRQAAFRWRNDRSRQQRSNLHEVVGEHGRADPQLESPSAFGETALHAATAEQHRDAPLDTCAKALTVLELPGLLIGHALGCFGAAPLWDAYHLDTLLLARGYILLTEKPAIRSIQFGDVAEGLLVALQRSDHVLFVDGVSIQYVILRGQAARALGEKDLVPELDRRLHLGALDEVGVGLENRIELLGTGNLLAVEHTAARLIDDTGSQAPKVLDLLARLRNRQVGDQIFAARFAGLPKRRSCAFDELLGNTDELAVFPGLMLVALLWSHPLNLLHPTPRRSRPISETLDTAASQRFGEATDQARNDANDIPQQRAVGRMMNVGLHHRGVDAQLLTVFQSEPDRRLHHQIIDRLERPGCEPSEAAGECIMSRHRQTIEVGELAQGASIGNPLAQFAIVPVLDAHENQRAQDLLRRQAAATSVSVLQAPYQIAADLLDHVLLVVKKIGDGLQQRLKAQTLTHQFPISTTDLSLCRHRHRSALVGLLRFGALSLQRFDVSRCRLVQQILQRAPVVQPALHLRNDLLRNIDRNATPFRAIVQHIALMLFARQTSRAVRANAPAAPQAQRAEKRRPQNRSFTLQPAHDIRRRFRINPPHVRYVSTDTRTFQENTSGKNAKSRLF